MDSVLEAVGLASADSSQVIDTVFVAVRDTLFIIPANNEGEWLGVVPVFATVIVAIVGVYVNWRLLRSQSQSAERELKSSVNRQWAAQADSRRQFWNQLRHGYDKWKQEIHWKSLPVGERPPEDLDVLLDAVGIPERMTEWSSLTPETWNAKRSALGGQARRLSDFADRVHPASGLNGSIVRHGSTNVSDQINRFYNIRAELMYSFVDWSEIAPEAYLITKFGDHRLLIIMVVWLEMSLVNELKGRWRYPKELMEFAKKIGVIRSGGPTF